MTLSELYKAIGCDFDFVTYNGHVYVLDETLFGFPDMDFGVWCTDAVAKFGSGKASVYPPDSYIENYLTMLKNDILCNQYNIPEEDIKQTYNYVDLLDGFRVLFKKYEQLKPLHDIIYALLQYGYVFESETITQQPNEEQLKNIKAFEEQYL